MIRGELTNLRAIERDDVAVVHRWLNDPAGMRGWGWSAAARSLIDVAREVEGWIALEAALGHPAALVGETLSREPVGLIVFRADRPEARAVELSLLVGDPANWGKGYGTDLLRSALDASFGGWGMHRIGVRVDEANDKALALYQRFGFKLEGRLREAAFLDGQHADILLLGLLASEWWSCEAPPATRLTT
jgi:RimJ/RimL family protein N-acetyltransferase